MRKEGKLSRDSKLTMTRQVLNLIYKKTIDVRAD